MKKIHNYALFTMLAFFGNWVNAQEIKTLTLDEAVDLGIKNSKYLKIDEAKIDEATANYIAAKNNRLPDFNISANTMQMPFSAKINLKILQNPGGNSGASAPEVHSVYYGQANFSLPIYAGGKIKYGIKSAEYLAEAAKLSAENDKTAVAYNIAEAYNNLYKAKQTIQVLKENLKAAQERDKTFLNLENNGVIARNDRLKANLQTSDIELQLLDAESNFDIANINMNLLLGLPETTIIEVDSEYISENLAQENVSYYLEQAAKNRKDLQALDYQKKAAELGTKAAKAENLPTVAITAGYIAADVPKVLTVYNAVNIGVGVQYNLGNLWKKNSALMNAESQIKKIDANNELVNDQIKLEVNRDFQSYILAKRKIEVYEKAVVQANENYRITKNKYDNGLETVTNLLDADAAQISANVNVLNAKADFALAYRKLLQTSGILD
ncbi:MAG: TolC family protein [Flavobacteriaceae bacterium]|jgi:outer membrane protein TolC|nr:TolC family protein [Flavobacteriaceae bacterium]